MVPHDVAVGTRFEFRWIDLIGAGEFFGRFSIVPSGLQGSAIRLCKFRLFAELGLNESLCRFQRTRIEPEDQTHREEVSTTIRLFGREAQCFDRTTGQGGHWDAYHSVRLNEVGGQRILLKLGKLQIFLGKAVLVHDQDAAWLQVRNIGDQRGRIHCNQRVQPIPWCENFFRGKLNLKSAHTRPRPSRCANLGGEVREGCDIISREGRSVRQLGS